MKHRGLNMSILIGICGGSGSGKTTLSERLMEEFKGKVTYVPYDHYCKDHSYLSKEERAKVNYDHPDAYEGDLLFKHIKRLLRGYSIQKPLYSFPTHSRRIETETIYPNEIIIVEGILVYQVEELVPLFDLKIYVEAEGDVRLARRMIRDISERGRSVESVVSQYLATVKPMYKKYIKPTKKDADIIFDNNGQDGLDENQVQIVVNKIKELLK
jgi:uridine kinase